VARPSPRRDGEPRVRLGSTRRIAVGRSRSAVASSTAGLDVPTRFHRGSRRRLRGREVAEGLAHLHGQPDRRCRRGLGRYLCGARPLPFRRNPLHISGRVAGQCLRSGAHQTVRSLHGRPVGADTSLALRLAMEPGWFRRLEWGDALGAGSSAQRSRLRLPPLGFGSVPTWR
jgi:hypothetical protein